MKHFLSMASTFRSLMTGRLALDDLRQAHLTFGNHKEVIHFDQAIPGFVMAFNTEKPKFLTAEAEYVDAASLDKDVAEKWIKFKLAVREAEREGRLTWSDGKNYPAKALKLLKDGHEVYWEGGWRQLWEFKYLDE
jgi:hypothetical protein